MLTFATLSPGNILRVTATGELSTVDFQEFLTRLRPLVEKYGKVRVAFELKEFTGWDPYSAWDDLMFSLRYKDEVRRFAVIGNDSDEPWMRRLVEPFVNSRHFAESERAEAWRWVTEGADEDLTEQIRRLAYSHWEAAGRPEGDGLRFWIEAERELHCAA